MDGRVDPPAAPAPGGTCGPRGAPPSPPCDGYAGGIDAAPNGSCPYPSAFAISFTMSRRSSGQFCGSSSKRSRTDSRPAVSVHPWRLAARAELAWAEVFRYPCKNERFEACLRLSYDKREGELSWKMFAEFLDCEKIAE